MNPLARWLRKTTPPAPPEAGRAAEVDEPTAPITPVVEIARSPHDRLRDLTIGNALVTNLDRLETVLRSGEHQTRESMLEQLALVRDDLGQLFDDCAFRRFEFEPGTLVDSSIRSRIQIVAGSSGGGPTRIVRTIRCGYLYEPGGDEASAVIRKAEVEIG